MTRAELKRNARQKLGGKLFGSNWVNAVLVIAIFYILTGYSQWHRWFWKFDHAGAWRPFKAME